MNKNRLAFFFIQKIYNIRPNAIMIIGSQLSCTVRVLSGIKIIRRKKLWRESENIHTIGPINERLIIAKQILTRLNGFVLFVRRATTTITI